MPRAGARQHHAASGTQASYAASLWSELLKPALIIALVGAGAVCYLVACARVSIIECDLRRLDRALEHKQTAELALQRQIAELQAADSIQQHISEYGLDRPSGREQVRLTSVPVALQDALPTPDSDRDTREILLGQIPLDSGMPLYASARNLQTAGGL